MQVGTWPRGSSSSNPPTRHARAIGGPVAATPRSCTGGPRASAPPARNWPNELASGPAGPRRPYARARRT
eukprot:7890074-Alexandrium_andersonii.AAC.1